jgi:hypothetical protein
MEYVILSVKQIEWSHYSDTIEMLQYQIGCSFLEMSQLQFLDEIDPGFVNEQRTSEYFFSFPSARTEPKSHPFSLWIAFQQMKTERKPYIIYVLCCKWNSSPVEKGQEHSFSRLETCLFSDHERKPTVKIQPITSKTNFKSKPSSKHQSQSIHHRPVSQAQGCSVRYVTL